MNIRIFPTITKSFRNDSVDSLVICISDEETLIAACPKAQLELMTVFIMANGVEKACSDFAPTVLKIKPLFMYNSIH